jgi:hypothetical protein
MNDTAKKIGKALGVAIATIFGMALFAASLGVFFESVKFLGRSLQVGN